MTYPSDWESDHPTASPLGHQEGGRTIVLHSVAILPHFQGRGLGRILMMAYMQQMNGAGIADRLALIAHDVSSFLAEAMNDKNHSFVRVDNFQHKMQWYEKLGFTNRGKSNVIFGGGDWYDMVSVPRAHFSIQLTNNQGV
jgi:ribosomal protein S18 acetylase RimI-like enzyme